MAVVFDAASSATNSLVTLTYSHTVTTAANRLLIVTMHESDSQVAIVSATYAGVAMTALLAQNTSTVARTELWYLIAPATGANDVVVVYADIFGHSSGAASFSGVNQTTPIGNTNTNSGQATVISTVIASVVGNMVYDALGSHSNVTFTPGAGQTERFDINGDNGSDSAGSTEPGAASVTMSWSDIVAGKFWAQVLVDIIAALPTVSRQIQRGLGSRYI